MDSEMSPSSPSVKPEDADSRAAFQQALTAASQHPNEMPIDPSMEWTSTQPDDPRAEIPHESEDASRPAAMTTTTRRNANGSTSSVYSGSKIRYLKKNDGEPFWRIDIQFLFLRMVFEDQNRVFTKASDGTYGHTFADVYIDAMAKSSKCSQILKEKLLTDRTSAVHMAMICLLVNVGRMNTTLNCKLSPVHLISSCRTLTVK